MGQSTFNVNTDFGEHQSSLRDRLAKAEADSGYYARMIQDTAERLQSVKAAMPDGTPPSNIHQTLEAHLGILEESKRQADDDANQIRIEMSRLGNAPLSLIQLADLMLSNWKAVQSKIEALEASNQSDPLELVSLITQREAIEKTIWICEYKIMVDLLLTHETMAAFKPLIEATYSAGIRAGLTESIEHFLVTVLAGVDGIRPTLPRIVEAQEEIAARIGIPV